VEGGAAVKRCRNPSCRKEFVPKRSTLEVCCSPRCGIEYARTAPKKRLDADWRKGLAVEKRDGLARLKTIGKLLQEAQREFNRWVLQRDFGRGCISCDNGPAYDGQWNAGHFRTTAAAPHLRFHPDNAWRQCGQCNHHKSGNVGEYRIRLVAQIGSARVEALEDDNRNVKWGRDELVELRHEYTAKWRALRAAREQRAA